MLPEALMVQVLCCRPGCSKPAYQGKKGNYCSKRCRDRQDPMAAFASLPAPTQPLSKPPVPFPFKPTNRHLCVRPGCKRETWNKKPGCFCSESCRDQGPAHETFCSEVSKQEWESLTSQLTQKWNPANDDRGAPELPKKIYKIHASAVLQTQFDRKCLQIGHITTHKVKDAKPGNVRRRAHGTNQMCSFSGKVCGNAKCAACNIMSKGFDISFLGKNTDNTGVYGKGHYTTSCFSTAKGYGNVILVRLVAVGKPEEVEEKKKASIPDGFDSRLVNKQSGVDEIVVPDDDQMLPRYLMLFD
mmetsp:Transcript_68496/g.161142  ORF Transcript_68496/g.161142 Transcript_68496/m.161142 type:complete len:300 (-) Transcript_68496:213-1112(-)